MTLSKKLILSLFVVSFGLAAQPRKLVVDSTVTFGSTTVHMTKGYLTWYKEKAITHMEDILNVYYQANKLPWKIVVFDCVSEEYGNGNGSKEKSMNMYVYDKAFKYNQDAMRYEDQKIDLLTDMAGGFMKILLPIVTQYIAPNMYSILFAQNNPELLHVLYPKIAKDSVKFAELVESEKKRTAYIKMRFGVIDKDLNILNEIEIVKDVLYPKAVIDFKKMQ